MSEARSRLAVVLFNLGGPARLEEVRPFLLSLFADPLVLPLPRPLRWWVARRIVAARLASALDTYRRLGGGSVLLAASEAQARALEAELAEFDCRCFVAMRHAPPQSLAVARAVHAFDPEQIVLLPLYPQFSTTTTGSSLLAWQEAAARAGLMRPVWTICCWFAGPAFRAAWSRRLAEAARMARTTLAPGTKLRLLFSAHGLPEKVIAGGDPYQFQIEQGAALLAAEAGELVDDWRLCYQSREATGTVWLGPSLQEEIAAAASAGVALLVVPLSFVSEHSETLVELDVEAAELAQQLGVPGFFRLPTPGSDGAFIAGLASLVRSALARPPGLCSHAGGRACPGGHRTCPFSSLSA